MRRFFHIIVLFLGFVSITSFTSKIEVSPSTYNLRTVVIDAGHGGKDFGAIGASRRNYEKTIALKIALQVGEMIKSQMPNVKVIYTREDDTFIELNERARIANRNKADLFISIHLNSAKNRAAYGTETFVMGLHVSEENLEVARRENSVILLEDNFEKNYDGFDPNSPEAYIIFSLYMSNNIDNSLKIASKIENQFSGTIRRNSRGVKQAGFLVLRETTMPAILVETGFISNVEEEKFLASSEGQSKLAQSIFNGFKKYKEDVESIN